MTKNRGKNKKKQWNRLMRTAEQDLEFAKNKKSIPLPPIKTVNTETEFKDVWESTDPEVKKGNQRVIRPMHSIDLPLRGQSYNPTKEDQEALLKFLEEDEKKKLAEVQRLNKFFAPTLKQAKNTDQESLAKEYFKNRVNSDVLAPHIQDTTVPGDDFVAPKPKKVDKEALKRKKHRIEMSSLKKIAKEVKKSAQISAEKSENRKLRKMIRAELKKPTINIAFQLPEEKAGCVRRLLPEGSLVSEVELRRSKIPLKRSKLNIDKNKKSFARRSRK
ncbi:Glioma tumor suppressor candidate region protein 2 [Cichlidogyrus casuarinus]|uniref:Glioma tumor suppressor candidate region protein 2 n=1 Tax=Cichlidogyrus casuarinus TaxID=1844966 RepID=A0ABD2QN63_9PLAT